MKIYLRGNKYRYELEHVVRAFVPEAELVHYVVSKRERKDGDEFVYFRLSETKSVISLLVAVNYHNTLASKIKKIPPESDDKESKRELAVMFYDIMSSLTGKRPAWGVLTGVRPVKLVRKILCSGIDDKKVISKLREQYRVSESKAKLAVQTVSGSSKIINLSGSASYSLYISIPFCPSRCEYCSFVSKTAGNDRQQLSVYLARLNEELRITSALASRYNLKLESIYIGGGTPTTLSEKELTSLLEVIAENFPVGCAREYTVEAGRPDTITLDKLKVLREHEVDRISINPQTFNDAILKSIGRRHTGADIIKAFSDAETAGFKNINADLIAGFEGDDLSGFQSSVSKLISLKPKGITVHTLTSKRGSFFREGNGGFAADAEAMVDEARQMLGEKGYLPYYLYRQKGSACGLENVGYSLAGFEGLYNVFIMDELHTILSCGASAVSKLYDPQTGLIKRIFNYKYPLDYIKGFDEIKRRKEQISCFYESIIRSKTKIADK